MAAGHGDKREMLSFLENYDQGKQEGYAAKCSVTLCAICYSVMVF